MFPKVRKLENKDTFQFILLVVSDDCNAIANIRIDGYDIIDCVNVNIIDDFTLDLSNSKCESDGVQV